MYCPIRDEQFPIPGVNLKKLKNKYYRQEVSYQTSEPVGSMMGGGMGDVMTINAKAFDMGRIDIKAKRGDIERWIVQSDVPARAFHIHGALFQVLKENGNNPRPEHMGWKDTVHIEQETELLVRFDHKASPEKSLMYHCHILEHEDAGMMGQFTVS